jgi:NTP pyrophosphatase (non-canonical NTP hydrolase)
MSLTDTETPIACLKDRIAEFARERDWQRYHSEKNLACAVAVEAGELVELFLWHDQLPPERRERLEAEIADVAICLLNLCQVAGVDLAGAIERKLAVNAARYPADKVRGSARKYDEY